MIFLFYLSKYSFLFMKKKFYLILLTLFYSITGFAQYEDLKFERISIKEGLSQVVSNVLFCDSKGFLWIGTQDGLNIYNGYEFKIFRPNLEEPEKSINNNIINSIHEDKNANIWIGTQGGLNLYDRKKERFYFWINIPNDSTSIPFNPIVQIVEDKNQNIWAISQNVLLRIKPNIENYQLSQITIFNRFTEHTDINNGCFTIIDDKYGNLWIFTNSSNVYYIPENQTNSDAPVTIPVPITDTNNNPIDINQIATIINDADKNICIITQNQISKITFNSNKEIEINKFKIPQLPFNQNINALYFDKNFNLIIGTANGLIIYQKNFSQILQYTNQSNNSFSLSTNIINNFVEDSFGILWVGTSNGLNKFDKRKSQLKHIVPEPLNDKWLQDGYTFAIAEDTNGEIWVGTANGNGIYIYNKDTNQFRNINAGTPNTIPSNFIRSFLIDDKNIWIGTNGGGLCKYNKKTKTYTTYTNIQNDSTSILSNLILKIVKKGEDEIWLATGRGIAKFNPKTEKFINYQNPQNINNDSFISNNIIRTLYFDNDNNLWIGTNGGGLNKMYVKDNKTYFKKYRNTPLDTNTISSNQIFDIYQDSDTCLWLATFGGGLNKFNIKTEKAIRYTSNDGLPSNVVYGILPDENGNLWLSTNNGISCFNIENQTFKNYSIEDGLQSSEFNGGAFFKDSKKRMYFGGINGYNVFYPNLIINDTIAPKMVFTDLKIFNKSVTPTPDGAITESILFAKEINLYHKDRDFTIEYAALHFASPGKNKYAYKMEGYDTEWTNAGTRRFVSYNSFPHGEYVFKVKAANGTGTWSQEIEIKIIIHPPFWQTKTFYFIIFVFFITIIAVFIKIREKKLIYEKQILEEKIRERTQQIQEQNEQILEKNEELKQQKEEIQAQADGLEEANYKILSQNEELERSNKHITDSIMYAKRIQTAVMPSQDILKQTFSHFFIFFKPCNIVSGDFYFFKNVNNFTYIAAADCTGHGVPGAFMSMLGITLISEIIKNQEIKNAARFLNELRTLIKNSLQQIGEKNEQQDGMDIALSIINKDNLEMSFAGAYNPCWIVRNTAYSIHETFVLPADRQPVGVYIREKDFSEQIFTLKQDDCMYLFTDGYESQFGGPKNEKFKIVRLKELIINIQPLTMPEQKQKLEQNIIHWQGQKDQTDDILIIGIKI